MAGSFFPDDPANALSKSQLGASSFFPPASPTDSLGRIVPDAAKKNPAQTAKIFQLQTKTGLPADLIERNLDYIETEANRRDFNADAFRKQSPLLAKWLVENPKHAALANDDLANLGALEWIVTAPQRAWKQGWAQVEAGFLASRLAVNGSLTEAEHKRLAELDTEMARGGDLAAESWFGNALTGGARQLPMLFTGMLEGAKTGLPASMGAATAAAVAGQMGPQVALPEEIATVPAAALTGYYIGQTAGSMRFGFQQESGHAYLEFRKFKDELGRPLDDGVARIAAIAAGAINAPIEAFQMNTILRSIPGADRLAGEATRSAVRQALASPTVRGALKGLALNYGKVLTTQTMTEVAQRAVTILSGELGKVASGQDIKPKTAGEIAADLGDEAVSSAQAFTFLSLPGPAMRAGRDTMRAREAAKNEAFFTALGEGVNQSKTFKRLPEKVQEFLARATKYGPIENVYVDADTFTQYWQSKGLPPAKVAEEIGIDREAFEQAAAAGQQIAIPTATYATKIAPTEHNAFFAAEMRFEYQTGLEQLAQQETVVDEGQRTADQSAAKIREDVIGQLVARGYDRGAVEAQAAQMEAAFRTMGQRSGIDPFTLYEPYGLNINRPMPDILRQRSNVDQFDALLDRLRSGQIPQQGEIFGPSLVEFLRSKGGVQDEGGKLRGRDPDKSLKPFQRKLINEQGMSLDDALTAAREAGYLNMADENSVDQMDINSLLDAIDEDLRGNPVYSNRNENAPKLELAQALESLDRYISELGLDLNALTNEQIKAAINEASQSRERQVGDVEFDQPFDGTEQARTPLPDGTTTVEVDGVTRSALNSNGKPIHWSVEGIRNFWRWFGESKVVDEQGRPVVVYHGTADSFDQFELDQPNRKDTGWLGRGFYFTNLPVIANSYANLKAGGKENVMPVYLRMENPRSATVDEKRQIQMSEMRGDANAAARRTDAARAAGFDGIILEYDHKEAGKTPVEYVVFSPEQIKSATGNRGTFDPMSGNILYQSDAQQSGSMSDKRGAIRFGADRQSNIDLFEKANLSTFLHESGHFYLEVMGDVVDKLRAADPASLNETQQRMIEDYGKLLKWLKVENRQQIGVEQHEQWARGIEAYFMEGKAPSVELRNVFARFRSWLVNIYRSRTQLNVELSNEVRGVMDRMFATEQEIEAAEREAQIDAMFTDAASAGMTDAEFKAYRDTVQYASDRAKDTLQAKLMRTIQRERSAWWKKERDAMRAAIAVDVYQQREYIALSVLQKGKMPDGSELPEGIPAFKLSRAALVETYGAEFLKRLPRPYVYAAKDGISPDAAADLLGFKSGDELVMAIVNARPMNKLIDAETDARMREQYPDPLTDGTVAEQARAAVHNDERSKVIHAEMRALAKKRREVAPFVQAERNQQRQRTREGISSLSGIPPIDVFRHIAQGRIDQMMVRDIRPGQYLVAARKASRLATDAAAKQDYDTAVIQKQRELLNVELYRAATKARDDADSAVSYMRKFGETKTRARIGKAGQDYLDQIDALLDRFSFARISLKAAERRAALAQWIAQKERDGQTVDLPDDVVNEAYRKDWSEMTYIELTGLRDSVRHIEHLARLKNKLLTAKKNRDLAAAVDEITTSINDNAKSTKGRRIETRLPKDEAARQVEGFFASHRKLSSLLREMDGFKDAGPLWEYLMRPINEAGNREAVMNAEAMEKLSEIFSAYKGKDAVALYHKTHIPAINMPLTKMGRIMVAMNWGNADSRQKLMDGYGWNESQVQSILDTLDERDCNFVQSVFDFFNSYWPQIEAKEKRVNGIAPDKVQAVAIDTPFGQFEGGYFPLKYDDRQSAKAASHAVKEIADQMTRGAVARSTTKRGHTKARVEGVKMPVRLDFGVLFEHTNQIIHDLTHHEMLIDAGRILGSKEVQDAIYGAYGDVTYDQIKKAMQDIAAGDIGAQTFYERGMNHLRTGTTVAFMGWSVMTALQQPFGLTQSMSRIGIKWVGRGLSRWMRDAASMESTAAWITEKSDMMRLRSRTQMREINEIRNQIGLSGGRISGWIDEALSHVTDKNVRVAIADSYFWLIYKGQQIADIPTWVGAYEKAMADNHDEATSIALADQAVLDAQGGGQIKDLAGIQRGGPLLKLWTNFYNYFNVTWNNTVESTKRTNFRDPVSVGRLAVDYLLLYALPATLAALMKEAIKGGDDDEDKLFAKLVRENLSYMAGTLVGLREIGGALQGYAGYEGPAGARFFAAIGKFIKQAQQGEIDSAFLRSINEAAGIVLHYPAGQARRTIEGAAALWEGKTSNPLVLLSGPPKN